MWSEFLALSGWQQTDPRSGAFEQSGDGEWWYRDNAEFARNYGTSNPREDFATAFSAYFMRESGLDFNGYSTSPSDEVGADAIDDGQRNKIAFMDEFFDSLQPHSRLDSLFAVLAPSGKISFR